MEWICVFVNAEVVKIYIGCNDNGEVISVNNEKKLIEDIPNKVRNLMGIIVAVNLLEKDDLEYIESSVPSYPVGISCKDVYYYRSRSTKQTLSGLELETFLLRRRGVPWDKYAIPVFSDGGR